jgi:hypothetical protein
MPLAIFCSGIFFVSFPMCSVVSNFYVLLVGTNRGTKTFQYTKVRLNRAPRESMNRVL